VSIAHQNTSRGNSRLRLPPHVALRLGDGVFSPFSAHAASLPAPLTAHRATAAAAFCAPLSARAVVSAISAHAASNLCCALRRTARSRHSSLPHAHAPRHLGNINCALRLSAALRCARRLSMTPAYIEPDGVTSP